MGQLPPEPLRARLVSEGNDHKISSNGLLCPFPSNGHGWRSRSCLFLIFVTGALKPGMPIGRGPLFILVFIMCSTFSRLCPNRDLMSKREPGLSTKDKEREDKGHPQTLLSISSFNL